MFYPIIIILCLSVVYLLMILGANFILFDFILDVKLKEYKWWWLWGIISPIIVILISVLSPIIMISLGFIMLEMEGDY